MRRIAIFLPLLLALGCRTSAERAADNIAEVFCIPAPNDSSKVMFARFLSESFSEPELECIEKLFADESFRIAVARTVAQPTEESRTRLCLRAEELGAKEAFLKLVGAGFIGSLREKTEEQLSGWEMGGK